MVGIMGATAKEKVAILMDSAKFAMDIPRKLGQLRQLKDELSHADSVLLSEFLPSLIGLHTDRFSPVRKFIAEILGDIGIKHMEYTPEIIPVLITILRDGTPAVARQAISCGIDLFRSTLIKVAIQGLYSSELDNSLESSWAWAQKFRDEIYSIAFQPRNDGTRLLALKFVEALLLLYTPDPCGSSEPPPYQASEGIFDFNISWLRGGHPVFNVGDLSIEASQRLGLLLDQLRFPAVKSLSNSTIIVLINSLSAIARKRPSFYGRILPVLLGLESSSSVNNGVCGFGVHHALKNAFLSCLECQHPGVAPWRDRLVGALREMKAEGLAEQALHKISHINGFMEGKNDSAITQEEKPSIRGADVVHSNAGRKRSASQDASDLVEDHDLSSKRARSLPVLVKSEPDTTTDEDNITSGKQATTRRDEDNGPVQQLVAMFGAVVSQGEKAIGSLEILISSISADLLAEVVMANMRNLPVNCPQAVGDEEPLLNKGSYPNIVGCHAQLKQLSSILAEMLPMSSTPMQVDSMLDAKLSASDDIESTEEEEKQQAALNDINVPCAAVEYGDEKALVPLPLSSSDEVLSARGYAFPAVPPEGPDVGNVESGIPGLDSASHGDELAKTLEDASQEQISSLGRSQLELAQSMSTERSEELSPIASVTEASSITSSVATSVGFPAAIILPKMSAPIVNLVEEEKDQIQKMAFTRIVEAYKQITIAGGSQFHSTLLAYLAVEFPLELDPWKILQKHILSDYTSHEGHELTLRVLYRLFREAEEERDFFSSTTATSVYETFLLCVAETLRDSFPASDKSLSKLLGEAPYLPKSLFKLLDGLCSPGNSDKDEKELASGDRVTQGLSAVWGLILLRPPIRDACLKIAMQSAVHHLEEVRMKAIRLVANKLYPLSSISIQIEDFAKEMLYSVSNHDDKTSGRLDGDRSDLQKDSNVDDHLAGQQSGVGIAKDPFSDTSQSCTSQNTSSSSLTEAQRCMSLYFALCTKKHSLFRELFLVYKSASDSVKQAVHHQIPILVRTIGPSTELLESLSDPPIGSKNLLMQVLHTLTDGTIPSPELVGTIRKLFDTKLKDVEVLIPILPYLPKDEKLQVLMLLKAINLDELESKVLLIFPHLVNLPLDKFQTALARLLQGSSVPDQVLSPAEVLIAIHGIDPDRDGIPLKKVTDACNACFELRNIFTQQVLAKVLNQLVEQIPLPLLFMRTVLQAIGAFPALVDFILEILSRLVNKQIWKYPKLWVGFLKCALLTKPQSFSVLLQLPPAQLENALHRTAALRGPLAAYASQPNIRSSLPRSLLVVLGIALDSQNSSQAQTTIAHNGDAGNSDKEGVTEKSKESSTAS